MERQTARRYALAAAATVLVLLLAQPSTAYIQLFSNQKGKGLQTFTYDIINPTTQGAPTPQHLLEIYQCDKKTTNLIQPHIAYNLPTWQGETIYGYTNTATTPQPLAKGEELVVCVEVIFKSDGQWYASNVYKTGPDSRNPDGKPHFRRVTLPGYSPKDLILAVDETFFGNETADWNAADYNGAYVKVNGAVSVNIV